MAKSDIKAIKAGRLIDGTGGAPIENVTVLIENKKIKEVGPNLTIPPGTETIDATGKTVMPGLINAHMHLEGPKTTDTFQDKMSRPREVGIVKAVFDAKDFLEGGFTTVKSCGGTCGVYLRQAVTEGMVSGLPRIIAAGFMLQNTFGSPYKFMAPEDVDGRTTKLTSAPGGEAIYCDGVDECIKATRYTLGRGSDFVKLWPRRGSMFNQEELKAISQTAAELGKFVTVHCESSLDSKNSILGGAKTIEHAYGIEEDAIELGMKADVIFTSNLSCWTAIKLWGAEVGMPPSAIEMAPLRVELMVQGYKRIKKLGATIAIGDDSGGECLVQKFGSSVTEMEFLVNQCDYTPMEAIVAATKNGALACFIGDKTGTIESGKFADVIVVDGDPSANISILKDKNNIKMVMLEGKIEINRL